MTLEKKLHTHYQLFTNILEAESLPNVHFYFEHKLTSIDFEETLLVFTRFVKYFHQKSKRLIFLHVPWKIDNLGGSYSCLYVIIGNRNWIRDYAII